MYVKKVFFGGASEIVTDIKKNRFMDFKQFHAKRVEGDQLQLFVASFALNNNLLEMTGLRKQKERSYTQKNRELVRKYEAFFYRLVTVMNQN